MKKEWVKMLTYTIEYDLTELKNLADNFAKNVQNAPEAALPNTAAAFQRASNVVRQMWIDKISNLPETTSAMVRSIKEKRNGDFDYSVYSDNRQMERLNNGSRAVEYDMKQTHPYGKKSRVTQSGKNKGVPYLIIPFRWGTPNGKDTKRAHFNNFIPQANYNTAVKGLKISRVNNLKKYFEANYHGESIERQGYNWAKFGRLTEDQAWNDRSVGMVRMKDVTGSIYFTFRIISAKSPANSWIYKKAAKPALNFMQSLEQEARIRVDEIIGNGIKADDEMYKNM